MERITFTNLETFKGRMIWESEVSLVGLKSIGAFKLKEVRNDFYIYPLDDFDIDYYADVPLRKNERLFRYETETTRIGKMAPIFKMNIESGLVYFVEDLYADEITFEKISAKPIWVNINADFKN